MPLGSKTTYFKKRTWENILKGYETMLTEAEKIGVEPDALAVCCREIADILFDLGKKNEAYKMYDKALSYNVSDVNIKAQILNNKAINMFEDNKDNVEQAASLLKEAVEISYSPLKQMVSESHRGMSFLAQKKRKK